MYTGGADYGCAVDENLWLCYALQVKTPLFFQPHFYHACNDICKTRFDVDLHNGVTHSNWSTLYKYLRNNVSS